MNAKPCKRPRVTIEPHPKTFATGATAIYHLVTCHVPACGFTYDAAVKTDAEDQAKWHRHHHRGVVPRAWIEKDVEYDVHCEPCGGHRRTFGTRADAQAWLDFHLSAEHGLVVCP